MGRVAVSCSLGVLLGAGGIEFNTVSSFAYAADEDPSRRIVGTVQHQNLRRVDQATVQVRDQEGNMVAQGVSNQAGEFHIVVPEAGTYSIISVLDSYRREYGVVKIGGLPPPPVSLTLAVRKEIALEIVAPLPAIQ